MSQDLNFDAIKEQYASVTNVGKVTESELRGAIAELSDAELSVNLMPLGIRLASEGDKKYTYLLSEAGKRLAAYDALNEEPQQVPQTETQGLPLIALAKATILHALDRFISEDCKVPEGCTHFDGYEVPTVEQVIELSEMIEHFGGITLTEDAAEGDFDGAVQTEEFYYNSDNPHPDANPYELRSLYKPGTRNLAFKKACTEAFYGQPISEAIVADVLARFERDVRDAVGTGIYASQTPEQIEQVVAQAQQDYADILAGVTDAPKLSNSPTEVQFSPRIAGHIVDSVTGEKTPITASAQGAKTFLEMMYGKPLSPELIEETLTIFTDALNAEGIPQEEIETSAEYIRKGLTELLSVAQAA